MIQACEVNRASMKKEVVWAAALFRAVGHVQMTPPPAYGRIQMVCWTNGFTSRSKLGGKVPYNGAIILQRCWHLL
jgi:hypothetical protein